MTEFKQKRAGNRATFRFLDDQFEYTYCESRSVLISGAFDYKNIRRFPRLEFERQPVLWLPVLYWIMALSILSTVVTHICLSGMKPDSVAGKLLPVGAVFLIAALGNLRHRSFARTLLDVDGKTVSVIQDHQHDQILSMLFERNKNALRKYAVIREGVPANAMFLELANFAELGVITPDEFETFRSQLAIGRDYPNPIGRPYAIEGEKPEKTLIQRRGLHRIHFDFYRNYVYITHTILFIRQRGWSVPYDTIEDLRSYTLHKNSYTKYSFFLFACFVAFFVSAGFLSIMFLKPPFVPFSEFVLEDQFKYSSFSLAACCTLFPSSLFNAKFKIFSEGSYRRILLLDLPDAANIINELSKHRIATLRQFAVYSSLFDPGSLATKFWYLLQDEVITATEYQALIAQVPKDALTSKEAPFRSDASTLH